MFVENLLYVHIGPNWW